MGIDAPEKIGPMLRLADVVAVTKGDLVSQAEREVYRYRIGQMNKRAVIRHVNGLTGQGCRDLAAIMAMAPDIKTVTGNGNCALPCRGGLLIAAGQNISSPSIRRET